MTTPKAAKYYPQDAEFLLEYEPRAVHYDVTGELSDALTDSTPRLDDQDRRRLCCGCLAALVFGGFRLV